uniref:LY6/PLAUR domain containing 6 n=1 Tax=Catharus ustulatus TaxID=91951 RepID=A0A8C3TZ83_CATUS
MKFLFCITAVTCQRCRVRGCCSWVISCSLKAKRKEAMKSSGFTSHSQTGSGEQGEGVVGREGELVTLGAVEIQFWNVTCSPFATPYPRGFKCFTCEKASDNYECNRWAPDVYCPRGTRYCLSQHMMKASGESVSVTKRCVALEECLSTGCTYIKHEEYKVCTSCCEGSICNLPLPRNASDAVFSTLSPLSATPPLSPPLGTPLAIGLALLAQRWLIATATATGQ